MRHLLFFILVALSLPSAAQDTLLVVDDYGEPLPFASVSLFPEMVALGPADERGRLPLPADLSPTSLLRVDYVGFAPLTLSLQRLRQQQFILRMERGENTTLAMPTVIGRRDELATNLPYQVETVNRDAIARAQSLTTADALADLSGVYVQKSQFGGGSPVIRGFEANRILLVVDGVRMNNAIFRNGHLQNAITVDPLALERLELIYGAGALAYGSDALGGVVHFRTREPGFRKGQYGDMEKSILGDRSSEKGNMEKSILGDRSSERGNMEKSILKTPNQPSPWNLNGALSFSSAARHFGQSLSVEYSAPNFASLTLLSTTFTSHLRAGAQRSTQHPTFGLRNTYLENIEGLDQIITNASPNRQIGTAYNQYNLLQKFRFRLRKRLELSANLQYSTTSDVPRYDALTERRNGQLRWARWDYGPQTRALASLRLQDRRPTVLYDLATYLLSHQFVAEDRIQRRFQDPLEENSLVDVNATNFQIDFVKDLPLLQLRYGFDFRHDDVASTAYLLDVTSGQQTPTPVSPRYPSQGSSLRSGGLYAEANRQLHPWWQLRGGLRYSRQKLNARFGTADPVEWPAAYLQGINNTEGALTGALGLLHTKGPHRWRTLAAQGFRAPNIDDFAKFRESNGFIQVPNPDLQPERSLTLESGYRYRSEDERLSFGLTAYHTWLQQAIIRSSGRLPDGSTSFVSRGDTLFAQTNVNAERARIYGVDVDFTISIGRGWRWATDLHYLQGVRDQLAPTGEILQLPQDHIPPPYGKASLGWERNNWDLAAVIRFQLAKLPEDFAVGDIQTGPGGYTFDRTGTADNLELTPLNPDGTFAGSLSWWTANLYATYDFNDRWSLRLKGENLLDRHYRTFASGVSAPGFNLGISLAGKLL